MQLNTGSMLTVSVKPRRRDWEENKVITSMLWLSAGQGERRCVVGSMSAIWNEIKYITISATPATASINHIKPPPRVEKWHGIDDRTLEKPTHLYWLWEKECFPRKIAVTQMTWTVKCESLRGVNGSRKRRRDWECAQHTCSKNSSIKPFSIPTATSSSSSVVSFPWKHTQTRAHTHTALTSWAEIW